MIDHNYFNDYTNLKDHENGEIIINMKNKIRYFSGGMKKYFFYHAMEGEIEGSLFTPKNVYVDDRECSLRLKQMIEQNYILTFMCILRLLFRDEKYHWVSILVCRKKDKDEDLLTLNIREIEGHILPEHASLYFPEKKYQDEFTYYMIVETMRSKVQEKFIYGENRQFAVAFVNMLNFYYINEHFGMGFGLELVQVLKEELHDATFMQQELFHICDDVFIICFYYQTIEEIKEWIKTREHKINEFLMLHGKSIQIKIKCGLYLNDDEITDVDAMIDFAKAANKSCRHSNMSVLIYDKEIQKEQLEQIMIVSNLDYALAQGEIEFYLQPKVSIHEDYEIAGAEALVRWNHHELGYIPPEKFIHVLENYQRVKELDLYIMKRVCTFIRNCIDQNVDIIPVSVNASYQSIMSDVYIQGILQLKDEYKIPDHCLIIEITETLDIQCNQQVLEVVDILHKQGFKIAMDDFGKGYSSLHLLSVLDIDELKLDKSLFDDMMISEKTRKVIRSILSMGKSMGMKLVAEGIEDENSVVALHEMNCDLIQGYYFLKPVPPVQFLEFVEQFHMKDDLISKLRATKKDSEIQVN